MTSEDIQANKHVPVTMHIPRNSGTYQRWLIQRFLVYSFEGKGLFNMRRLYVEQHDYDIVFYCRMLDQQYLEDSRMETKNLHIRQTLCTLETFIEFLQSKRIVIYSVVLISKQTHNLDMRSGWFKVKNILKNQSSVPLNYITIRDVFDRQQSVHNYLISPESKHEPTHNKLSSSFDHYIQSDQLEDSWLIRTLTGLPINCPIDHYWVTEALDFIDKMKINIIDTRHVLESLEIIYNHCFGLSFMNKITEESTDLNINLNKTSIKKIQLHDLSYSSRCKFLKRTRWDRFIYKQLLNRNILKNACIS